MASEKELAPIIIKKVKKYEAGHHGGAWKVAYADFVTAMMAFFLLMWLLNVTTAEEKEAISSYFDPAHPKISSSQSGAGGILGGLSVSVDGAMVTNVQPITSPPPRPQQKTSRHPGQQKSGTESVDESKAIDAREIDLEAMTELEKKNLEKKLQEVENERFQEAMSQIQNEIESTPELAKLSEHLMMDITPEGLRIQIVDKDGRSMFPIGSADMYPFTNELIKKVSSVIQGLPNQISIKGHTDGAQYSPNASYNNWDLSSDRAQSSRRALTANSFPASRIETVVGRADRDHLVPEDPLSAQNRRISIILLRDSMTRDQPASVEDLKEKLQKSGATEALPDYDAGNTRRVIITRPQNENTAPTQNEDRSNQPRQQQPAPQQQPSRPAPTILENPNFQNQTPRVLEFP